MNKDKAELIIEKTKDNYNIISEQFSGTRHYDWSEFHNFAGYLNDGDNLLDLGCGNGRLYKFIADKVINYTGLDISEKLIEIAKKNTEGIITNKPVFVSGDMTKLPFKSETFNQLWAVASIYHIPSKKLRSQTFAEISRVMKKNGIFIMTFWNMWHYTRINLVLKNIISKIIGRSDLEYFDAYKPWKNNHGEVVVNRYCHAFTLNEVRKILKFNGMEIIKKYYSQKEKKAHIWNGYNGVIIATKL